MVLTPIRFEEVQTVFPPSLAQMLADHRRHRRPLWRDMAVAFLGALAYTMQILCVAQLCVMLFSDGGSKETTIRYVLQTVIVRPVRAGLCALAIETLGYGLWCVASAIRSTPTTQRKPGEPTAPVTYYCFPVGSAVFTAHLWQLYWIQRATFYLEHVALEPTMVERSTDRQSETS